MVAYIIMRVDYILYWYFFFSFGSILGCYWSPYFFCIWCR